MRNLALIINLLFLISAHSFSELKLSSKVQKNTFEQSIQIIKKHILEIDNKYLELLSKQDLTGKEINDFNSLVRYRTSLKASFRKPYEQLTCQEIESNLSQSYMGNKIEVFSKSLLPSEALQVLQLIKDLCPNHSFETIHD